MIRVNLRYRSWRGSGILSKYEMKVLIWKTMDSVGTPSFNPGRQGTLSMVYSFMMYLKQNITDSATGIC